MNAKFTPERLKIPRSKFLQIGGRSGIYRGNYENFKKEVENM